MKGRSFWEVARNPLPFQGLLCSTGVFTGLTSGCGPLPVSFHIIPQREIGVNELYGAPNLIVLPFVIRFDDGVGRGKNSGSA